VHILAELRCRVTRRRQLQPHFDVVALVKDGCALVSAAAQLPPDVIVADISMPSLDGIDATRADRAP
jgi:CheY-like chemotaxis protein